ncbi:WD40 repeat-like protein [Peniophora sp. CONT]|nr:WD40 repeat-like protein [Peniophora sp. CONT]
MDGDSEDDFRNEDAELDEEDGDDDELDRQLFDAIEEVAEEAATEDAPNQFTRLTSSRIRRNHIKPSVYYPRSYTVEAVAAMPHPVPTHSLAATPCMTHLLTGSEDGYIRDYDIFSAVNGKVLLSAPQRHHAGVVEGILKAGQLRSWWEHPSEPPGDELSPVHSLAIHGDALWSLAGTNAGYINLYTVRHDPGRLVHSMKGHNGPVSALSISHDEKGFFSAGQDGDAVQWDLNTGSIVRRYAGHGPQLTSLAVRPLDFDYPVPPPPITNIPATSGARERRERAAEAAAAQAAANADAETKSESGDSLFGDEPDGDVDMDKKPPPPPPQPKPVAAPVRPPKAEPAPAPKNAPPLLDSARLSNFSPDIFMTSSIDGQVVLWDARVPESAPGYGVGRLWMSAGTPPWCLSACWSMNGAQVYAGRRNGAIDVWDVRQFGQTGPTQTPRLLKTLRNPASSGIVSCVVSFPDGRHIACASNDNIRLWNAAEAGEGDVRGRVQFKIIPGHHGGIVSQMVVDPAARFLVSASGNRGWHGDATRTVFVHDIKPVV